MEIEKFIEHARRIAKPTETITGGHLAEACDIIELLQAEVDNYKSNWDSLAEDALNFETKIEQLKAENDKLKETVRVGCNCNREAMIRWLKENKVASDQDFEKEKTIVLRMFVVSQALKGK